MMPPRPASHRRSRSLRAAAVLAATCLLLGACSRDADVAVEGPSTSGSTPGSTVTTQSLGTFVAPETTTTSPSTTPPVAAPAPAPASTTRPTAAGPGAARQRWIAPDAPDARPDVNVYDHISSASTNPVTAGARSLVYVPHEVSGTTMVIDPATRQVIDTFTSGAESQHVVPSFDMTTLYAVAGRGGQLTPIDPTTGKPGAAIAVQDPYNLYFTPDGTEAIVVAEGQMRLDFRDAKTLELRNQIQTRCYGLNHLDYSADFRYFIASCEFDGTLIKFDMATRSVVATIRIDMAASGRRPRSGHAQPQDVRLSSDGTVFFVADLQSDGLYMIDGESFRQVGFIPAGVGTHSLYPSRDGRTMYVINRGTNIVGGPPRGPGSVSVFDPYTRQITADWPVPGGGSPDMGNITADGTQLWLGGRYDGEVYVFDLVNGGLSGRIPVGRNPHGLTVWPQPGRFSLGHTGNMR